MSTPEQNSGQKNSALPWLAIVLVAAIAAWMIGRSGIPASNTPASTASGNSHQFDGDSSRTIGADTKLIEDGQFETLSFTLNRETTVTVHVSLKGGQPIDAYFVNEQGLNDWQSMAQGVYGARFSYFPNLSMAPLASDYTQSGTLPAGKYALVLNNSRLGGTAKPFHLFSKHPALVEYSVTVHN
jgi:hypothetical protein